MGGGERPERGGPGGGWKAGGPEVFPTPWQSPHAPQVKTFHHIQELPGLFGKATLPEGHEPPFPEPHVLSSQ